VEAAYDARTWFTSLSAHRLRGSNDATGEAVASIPADQIAVTFGLRAMEGRLTYGARARFVDAQTRTPSGVPAAAGYSTLDLFAAYKPTDSLTLNLTVDNVTDKQYIVYRDQSASPGLNARLGLTFRLGAP
jgi:hemoglobin/transferrin/lactoferrin receptor protein